MRFSDWLKDDGSENFGVAEELGPKEFRNPCVSRAKVVDGTVLHPATPSSAGDDDLVLFARPDGCKNDPVNFEKLGLDPIYQWKEGIYAGTCGPGYAVMTGAGPMFVDHDGVYKSHLWIGVRKTFKKVDDKYLAVEAWERWLADNNLLENQCIELIGKNMPIIDAAWETWQDILNNKEYRTWYHRAMKDTTIKDAVKPAVNLANGLLIGSVNTASDVAQWSSEKATFFGPVLKDILRLPLAPWAETSEETKELLDKIPSGDKIIDYFNDLGDDLAKTGGHKKMGEYTTAGWIYRETMRNGHPDRVYVTDENYKLYDGEGGEEQLSNKQREAKRKSRYLNSMLIYNYADENYANSTRKVNYFMEKHGYFSRRSIDPSFLEKTGIKRSHGVDENYVIGFKDNIEKVKFFLGMHHGAELSFGDISSLTSDSPSPKFRENYRSYTHQTARRKIRRPMHMAETGVAWEEYQGRLSHRHHDFGKQKRKISSVWMDANENGVVDPGEISYPVRAFDGSRFGDNPYESHGWGDVIAGGSSLNYNNEFYGVYKLIVDGLEYQPFALIDYSFESRMKNLKRLIPFLSDINTGEDVLNVVPYFLADTHELGFQSNAPNVEGAELKTVDYYSNKNHDINRENSFDTVHDRVTSLKNCKKQMSSPVCKQLGPWKRKDLPGEELKGRAYLVNPLVGTEDEKVIIPGMKVIFLDSEAGKDPWEPSNVKRVLQDKNLKIKRALDKIQKELTSYDPDYDVKNCCYYGERNNPAFYFNENEKSESRRGYKETGNTSIRLDPTQPTHVGGGMQKLIQAKGDKNSHGELATYTEFWLGLLAAGKLSKGFDFARKAAGGSKLLRKAVGRLGSGSKSAAALETAVAGSIFVAELMTDAFLSYLFIDGLCKMMQTVYYDYGEFSPQDVKDQVIYFAIENQKIRGNFLEAAIKEIDQKVSKDEKIGSVENFCSKTDHGMYFVNIFGQLDSVNIKDHEAQEDKAKRFIENISNSQALLNYKKELNNLNKRQQRFGAKLEKKVQDMVKSVGKGTEGDQNMIIVSHYLDAFKRNIVREAVKSAARKRMYLQSPDGEEGKAAINDLILKAKKEGMTKSASGAELGEIDMSELSSYQPYLSLFYDYYYMLLSICYYKKYESELIKSLDLDNYISLESKLDQEEQLGVDYVPPEKRVSAAEFGKRLRRKKREKKNE